MIKRHTLHNCWLIVGAIMLMSMVSPSLGISSRLRDAINGFERTRVEEYWHYADLFEIYCGDESDSSQDSSEDSSDEEEDQWSGKTTVPERWKKAQKAMAAAENELRKALGEDIDLLQARFYNKILSILKNMTLPLSRASEVSFQTEDKQAAAEDERLNSILRGIERGVKALLSPDAKEAKGHLERAEQYLFLWRTQHEDECLDLERNPFDLEELVDDETHDSLGAIHEVIKLLLENGSCALTEEALKREDDPSVAAKMFLEKLQQWERDWKAERRREVVAMLLPRISLKKGLGKGRLLEKKRLNLDEWRNIASFLPIAGTPILPFSKKPGPISPQQEVCWDSEEDDTFFL
jgi:hypothetical protein